MMVFSVGPSGVCWAVDKKETVLNHPLDIRFIKIRMVKDQLNSFDTIEGAII